MAKKKRSTPKTPKTPKTQTQHRSYSGAMMGRLTSDWFAPSTSSDAELWSSLKTLRNRSRDLCRNNDYARNALRVITNSVVGKGVTFQSRIKQRRGDKYDEKLNDQIETLWEQWTEAEYCHTAGRLNFTQLEHLILASIVESGEVLIRLINQQFSDSPVRFALEIIESDQLNESLNLTTYQGREIRMGVEVDEWQRPVAYWVHPRHPGDIHQGPAVGNAPVRIPASEIIHLFITERPNQTRGIPWLASALMRLYNVGGYEESELVAARAQAAVMGFIQSNDPDGLATAQPDGTRQLSLEPGTVEHLYPGETFNGFAPTRPNQALDPFLKFMLRGVASGIGISYAALTKDYTDANYSSLRASELDERDTWQSLQNWLIGTLHKRIYTKWLEAATLGNALSLPGYEIDPRLFCRPQFSPRGFAWVDPQKDIEASKQAILSGLSTVGRELASQGVDYYELIQERKREIELAKEAGVKLDVYPETTAPPPEQATPAEGGAQQPPESAQTPAPTQLEGVAQAPQVPDGMVPVRALTGERKAKNCSKSKPCGASCIATSKTCLQGLTPQQKKLAKAAQKSMKAGKAGPSNAINPVPTAAPAPTTTKGPSADISGLRSAIESGDFDAMATHADKLYQQGQQNATDLGIDFHQNIAGGNGTTDPLMNVIVKEAGFNEAPTHITKADMAALNPKDHLVLYRNPSVNNFDTRFDQFKNDPDYTSGRGIYCSGTYVAANYGGTKTGDKMALKAASAYGNGTIKMAYDKADLKVVSGTNLTVEQAKFKDALDVARDAKLSTVKVNKADLDSALIGLQSQKASTSPNFSYQTQHGTVEHRDVTLRDPVTKKFTTLKGQLVQNDVVTPNGQYTTTLDPTTFHKTKREAINSLIEHNAREQALNASPEGQAINQGYERIKAVTIGDDVTGSSGRFAVLKGYDFVQLNQAYDPTYGLLLNRSKIKVQDSKYK
jgi:lambda family phage portal protein